MSAICNHRVFIRDLRSENSPATTHNSLAKFCLLPERALPFHNNPPVTLQYSPATRILNGNLESSCSGHVTLTNSFNSKSLLLN